MNRKQLTAIKQNMITAVMQTIATEMDKLNELETITSKKGKLNIGTIIIYFQTDDDGNPKVQTATLTTTTNHTETLNILQECIDQGTKPFNDELINKALRHEQ